MVAWWVHNLKYKELYEWYQQQQQPKAKRVNFRERVIRYWYDRDSALNPTEDIWRAKRCKHIVYDDNGRVCNKCWEYKKRDLFSYSKSGFNKHTPMCKECRNKYHNEHRQKTWYKADREYRDKKRHLNTWDQIYFNSEIREVKDYKYNKWYTVKSIVNWEERRISTMDNHYRRNNSCVRFTKLKTPVELVQPKEEEKKFEINLDDILTEWND